MFLKTLGEQKPTLPTQRAVCAPHCVRRGPPTTLVCKLFDSNEQPTKWWPLITKLKLDGWQMGWQIFARICLFANVPSTKEVASIGMLSVHQSNYRIHWGLKKGTQWVEHLVNLLKGTQNWIKKRFCGRWVLNWWTNRFFFFLINKSINSLQITNKA